MKLYYVANARMPSEKAHGIQIAKMCEAFAALGVSVELIVSGRGVGNLKEFYGLSRDIPTRRIPVIDLQFLGPLGFRLTALQFVIGALGFLFTRVLRGEQFTTYTIDMDAFSFAPLALVPRPLMAEMHSAKKSNVLTRFFFKHAHVVATNTLIADELAFAFQLPRERLIVEPNGVDASALEHSLSQKEARQRLGLGGEPFALYVGRIYPWKGLEILAKAATDSPLPIYLVGGTHEEYESVTGESALHLECIGSRKAQEVPLWLAAADVVLVLGTAKNEDSYRYTSPMKLFEYLAARRPVVAAKTPANESIIKENAVFWYTPDDHESLCEAIRTAYTSPTAREKIETGYRLALDHTWHARAKRILAFVADVATLLS
jgi:glycosyltransferase involved in cell wall biosynthesis